MADVGELLTNIRIEHVNRVSAFTHVVWSVTLSPRSRTRSHRACSPRDGRSASDAVLRHGFGRSARRRGGERRQPVRRRGIERHRLARRLRSAPPPPSRTTARRPTQATTAMLAMPATPRMRATPPQMTPRPTPARRPPARSAPSCSSTTRPRRDRDDEPADRRQLHRLLDLQLQPRERRRRSDVRPGRDRHRRRRRRTHPAVIELDNDTPRVAETTIAVDDSNDDSLSNDANVKRLLHMTRWAACCDIP